MTPDRAQPDPRTFIDPRRRGSAAVLAMMFLVIFGSLAAAMAIVSQGNLATADSQLKINRSLAAAESGLLFVESRLNHVAQTVKTREGLIDGDVGAPAVGGSPRQAH